MLATEAPIARVYGEPLTAVPEDLFIPPEALRVNLERKASEVFKTSEV